MCSSRLCGKPFREELCPTKAQRTLRFSPGFCNVLTKAFVRVDMRKYYSVILSLLLSSSILLSCRKESLNDPTVFYGKWLAEFGDTLTFSRVNGKNMVNYNMVLNSISPRRVDQEYLYQEGKLGFVIAVAGYPDATLWFDSFQWTSYGKTFTVHGGEMFPYLSSVPPAYTYTKLP